MSTTYTALAIGPIYKTLGQARKTRELWGGSYLFSYIMRRLIEEIGEQEKCCLPYHPDILTKWKYKGAGLFPDRLIFEGDIMIRVTNAETKVIKEIQENTGLSLEYLENYIRVYALTYTLPQEVSNDIDDAIKNAENNNIVLVANKLLDTLELKEKQFRVDINNIDWKKAIDKINGKLFYKEAFQHWEQNRFEFPSIIEIATDDFRRNNKEAYYKLVRKHLQNQEESDQKAFQDALRAATKKDLEDKDKIFKPIEFRPYHKYIAVVQADGDNIGKTIAKIGDKAETVRDFSAALFDFAIAAQNKIKSYGGKAVYVGGDDLLFFAPVAIYGEGENVPNLKSIFGLIKDIDKVFEEKLINCDKLKHLYTTGGALADYKPSMSYGVSITYSKYPLNEARDTAYHLMNTAKAIKDDKNKICFKLHKHSGQSFDFTVDKKQTNISGTQSFDYFMGMVNNIPLQEGLLSSVIYKLVPLHKLLNSISKDKDRLTDFFDQEFELDKLKKKREEGRLTDANDRAKLIFIENIVNFFHQLSVEFSTDNKDIPELETEQSGSNIDKLYSTLRFMKHLTVEEDE